MLCSSWKKSLNGRSGKIESDENIYLQNEMDPSWLSDIKTSCPASLVLQILFPDCMGYPTNLLIVRKISVNGTDEFPYKLKF